MELVATGAVTATTAIKLHRPHNQEEEVMTIQFGNEEFTLDFMDPEALERLRDIATG